MTYAKSENVQAFGDAFAESISAAQRSEPRAHEYGVTPIEELHDREIAVETLYWLREAGKAIAQFQSMGMGGVVKAMMSGKK